MNKRKPGRPKSLEGPRKHSVRVSLHADELATIEAATTAPAQFLREEGLKAAKAHPKK